MIVFIFLLFCAVGFAVQFLYNRRQFYKFADNFPQPKACPIGGHAYYFLGKDDEGEFYKEKIGAKIIEIIYDNLKHFFVTLMF